jgi:hypothetical protein
MWAVAAPVVVAEKAGVIGALSRSRELTKGARWKILGLFLVVGSDYPAQSRRIEPIRPWRVSSGSLASRPVSWQFHRSSAIIIGMITSAVSATFQTSLYVELRSCEGRPPDADARRDLRINAVRWRRRQTKPAAHSAPTPYDQSLGLMSPAADHSAARSLATSLRLFGWVHSSRPEMRAPGSMLRS